ncbi:hypothetical protein EWM64_g2643 [Hericium alpestre]|uniref:Uncharacterized protein n=1 Tax=Hericium alpestre TaxID=135208 RepID=A0A4Z0A6U0_9AGAM|nr:hypothetical protein EWM64_g2643 [Hericium alpestre]
MATASTNSGSDPEDILSNSLGFLYDYAPVTYSSAGSVYTYISPSTSRSSEAPLTVTLATPETHAKNWSLHASSIWVASIYIADHLDDLDLDVHPSRTLRILELGAGVGLPGILAAKRYSHVRVTSTDYPDEGLIRELEANVRRNEVSERCGVIPYAWGSDVTPLRVDNDIADVAGFDIVIAADTLWNPETHRPFITTLHETLARTADARIHLVAGMHTGPYVIQSFLNTVQKDGLEVVEASEREVKGDARRDWDVGRAEWNDERERRRWVIWVVLRWKTT